MERRAALHEERRYDARVAQLVELHVANVVVAGSSPVSRSKDGEGREVYPENAVIREVPSLARRMERDE